MAPLEYKSFEELLKESNWFNLKESKHKLWSFYYLEDAIWAYSPWLWKEHNPWVKVLGVRFRLGALWHRSLSTGWTCRGGGRVSTGTDTGGKVFATSDKSQKFWMSFKNVRWFCDLIVPGNSFCSCLCHSHGFCTYVPQTFVPVITVTTGTSSSPHNCTVPSGSQLRPNVQ